MIYTVTMNPAIDYIMHTKSLDNNDVNRSFYEELHYGGKGINVSAVLSHLGIENKAFGFAAGFSGVQLCNMLNEDGISNDFVFLDKGCTRINVKLRADRELAVNAAGPEIDDESLAKLLGILDVAGKDDFLVLAGSVPPALSDDIYETIIESAVNKSVKFVVDAAGGLLLKTLKHKPFLIKPNHYELGDIFNTEIKSYDDVIEYAGRLKRMGAVNVLVSCAENGAMLIDEYGKAHFAENFDGEVKSTVGCGDSMVAGFIAGYEKRKNYDYALKLAVACANAAAFSVGLADKEGVEALMSLK